jgi:hypothetical protein
VKPNRIKIFGWNISIEPLAGRSRRVVDIRSASQADAPTHRNLTRDDQPGNFTYRCNNYILQDDSILAMQTSLCSAKALLISNDLIFPKILFA